MKTYTQALRTGVDNLWDTPKTERKFDMDLHGGCTLDAYNTQSLSHYKSENESFSYLVKIKKMINKKRKSLLLIATLFALQGANTAHAATTSNVDSLRTLCTFEVG
jgi:predicted CopG family antitoxin